MGTSANGCLQIKQNKQTKLNEIKLEKNGKNTR
jgi:hypothetical protein